jgi:hypothetical protein
VPVPALARGWEEQEGKKFDLRSLLRVIDEAVVGESLEAGWQQFGRRCWLACGIALGFWDGAHQLVIQKRLEQEQRCQIHLLRSMVLREAGLPVPICGFRI